MECIKFDISGKTAFFKRKDTSGSFNFTYNHIHKIALLGILGNIISLNGYNQIDKKDKLPEFYNELKDLKISIIPNVKKGIFNKKIQTYNNSSGYANDGGNLIVNEQWLFDTSWTIYLSQNKIDKQIFNKIYQYLSKQYVGWQLPYLGRREHIADISNVELLDLKLTDNDNVETIDSLFSLNKIKIDGIDYKGDRFYKFEENAPIKLDKIGYITETLCFTNSYIDKINDGVEIYKDELNNKNIYFI